ITQYSQLNGFVGAAIDNINTLPAEDDRQWISTIQGAAGTWYEMINWAFISGHWGITAYFDEATGISEMNDDEVSVYPNPAQDEAYITLPFKSDQYTLEWFDERGRKISVPGENIGEYIIGSDVSDLPSGIYFCRIISNK